MNRYRNIVDEIREKQNITQDQLRILLDEEDTAKADVDYLYKSAREAADTVYGKRQDACWESYVKQVIT